MKNIYILIILNSLVMNIHAQNFEWAKREGLWEYDYGYGIANDNAGNVYVSGKYEQKANFSGTIIPQQGNHDIYVAKYNPAGALIWIRTAGGYDGDYARALACDGSNYVYIAGEIQGSGAVIKFIGSTITLTCRGNNDAFFAKYDLNGNLIWAKQAGGSGNDEAQSITYDNSGNVYVCGFYSNGAIFGTTSINGKGGYDMFVAKYDQNGVFQWVRTAGGPGRDEAKSIKCDAAGNVYVCGMYKNGAVFGSQTLTSPNGYFDAFLAKYTPDGTLEWVKTAGGDYDDVSWSLTIDNNNKIYVTGEFNGYAHFGSIAISTTGSADIFVACYNSSGTIEWVKKAGGKQLDRARGIGTDGTNIYITGQFGMSANFGPYTVTGVDNSEIFIAKLNNDGFFQWAESVGGPVDLEENLGYESGTEICAEASGNVYVTGALLNGGKFGSTSLNAYSRTDAFITKISQNSGSVCSSTGSISRELWTDVAGTSVTNIPVNTVPTTTSLLTTFEAPTNVADNYGQRIRGYICPPHTGSYIFWIASDDSSELWLSTDNNPANKQKTASVSGWTASKEWTKYPSQKSVAKNLIAGQKYYIEALHKEGSQGDNCAVGWQLPNGTLERPVPGSRLSPFAVPLNVSITSPLNNASFGVGNSVTIQAAVAGGTGTIQKVEFFSGTTKIGEDLTSPYSFIWNNVSEGNYQLSAEVTDSGNNNAVSSTITINVSPTVSCSATGSISQEIWNNVSGTSVSSIPLNTAPGSTTELSIFQSSSNIGDNYGQRISGYVCPPATGNYNFWIASDDNSELWLSTDDNPANKQKIASVPGWTASMEWTKYPSQQSASKNLIAGQKYYIEALHKEGAQGDNCAVCWQLPNGTFERPIPGSRLSPFELIPPSPSIELIAAGSSWKYLDNGSDQGTAWRTAAFNDATWKTGNAELGYGDGAEATVVSYGPSSINKYITTYFRKVFNVSDISAISSLELSLIRDDGAAVYINGIEVYRINLPSGTIYFNTLAPSYIDGAAESTYVIANISASAIVNGNNVIAVEIHQNAKTSSDISFNLKLKTLSGLKIMNNAAPEDSIHLNTISNETVEMIVYPNPNTGKFNLEFCIDDLQEKTVAIEITNAFGQVVYNKISQKINGCLNETIELESDLPTGIYILKVSIEDKIQTAKMLLTK